MKAFLYKLKFIFSNPFKIIWKSILKMTSFLGALTTIFGILDTCYKNSFHMTFLTQYLIWFVLVSLIVSFLLSINFIPKISYKINGTDSFLSIKVGDISKYKKSIIVSTNTSFVTTMQNDIISPTSVQGILQNKFYKERFNELDKDICESLSCYKPKADKLILDVNKKKKYPIYDVGTVAKVREHERNLYFLALNDINSSGQNSSRSSMDFYTAIDKLWIFIKQRGNTEEAAIHLIGSGHAGISEITKEQALKDIVKSYVGQVQNHKILSHLTIFIYPADLRYINVRNIKKYIEHQCLFAEKNSIINGNAE